MKISCWIVVLAWILWIHNRGPGLDTWSSASGFASEKQCGDNVAEKLKIWRQFKDAQFNGTAVTFTESKMTITYLCLADTQDPRPIKRPKPGRRN